MRELLAAPSRRLFLAAGAALVALTLPLGYFGAAVFRTTTVPLTPVRPTAVVPDPAVPVTDDPAVTPVLPADALSRVLGGIGDAGDAADVSGFRRAGGADDGTAVSVPTGALAQVLENLATAGDDPATGVPTGALAQALENLAAAGDDPAASTDLLGALAASLDDAGAFAANQSLRTADLGRYLVLAVGLLVWAGISRNRGRAATVPTVAAVALVGYVVLSLLRLGITSTLFMLLVAFALALSTVVTLGLPGRRAGRPA